MSRKKLEDWRKRGQRQPLWGAKVYERCSELPPGANGSSPNRELLTGDRVTGAVTQSGLAQFLATITEPGFYSLQAHGSGKGDYQLLVTHINDLSSAVPIEYGRVISGNIRNSVDVFSFQAVASDLVHVSMRLISGTLEPEIRVYGPDGSLIIKGNAPNYGLAQLRLSPNSAGAYTLLVDDYGDTDHGAYQLRVSRLNNPVNTISFAYGDFYSGSIQRSVDIFSFFANAGDRIYAYMGSTIGGIDPQIILFGPDGTLIGSDGNHSTGFAHVEAVAELTGTHVILADDLRDDDDGEYKLALTRFNNPPNAIPLEYGDKFYGFIMRNVDIFSFQATAGDQVSLSMSVPGTMQPSIRLYGPDGKLIKKHASSSGLAKIESMAAITGTYALWAGENFNNESGEYILTLNRSDNPLTVPISVVIVNPTPAPGYTYHSDAIHIIGSASSVGTVTRVIWRNDSGGSGEAQGTNRWTISDLPLNPGENQITITAQDDKNRSASDVIKILYLPNEQEPVVTILSPTSEDVYETELSTINLAGTLENVATVRSFSWSYSRGGSGQVSGFTSWSVNNLALRPGLNVFTVTAVDANDNVGTDDLRVTYLPPGGLNLQIPDAEFKDYLVSVFDTDGDHEISYIEAEAITAIDAPSQDIANLSGVEFLGALQSLGVSSNLLTEIPDLSGLTALVEINMADNQLQVLAGFPSSLTRLYLAGNRLESVPDLEGLNQLEVLDLRDNLLDPDDCPALLAAKETVPGVYFSPQTGSNFRCGEPKDILEIRVPSVQPRIALTSKERTHNFLPNLQVAFQGNPSSPFTWKTNNGADGYTEPRSVQTDREGHRYWQAFDIPLRLGLNTVVVEGFDEEGIRITDSIEVLLLSKEIEKPVITPIFEPVALTGVGYIFEVEVAPGTFPIDRIEWDFAGERPYLSFPDESGFQSETLFRFREEGKYPVRVLVFDKEDFFSETMFEVTVEDLNLAPEIHDFQASPSATEVGREVVFTVSATDPNADVLTYNWFAEGLGKRVLERRTPSAQVAYAFVEPGRYQVTVDVDDSDLTVSRTIEMMVADVNRPSIVLQPNYMDESICKNQESDASLGFQISNETGGTVAYETEIVYLDGDPERSWVELELGASDQLTFGDNPRSGRVRLKNTRFLAGGRTYRANVIFSDVAGVAPAATFQVVLNVLSEECTNTLQLAAASKGSLSAEWEFRDRNIRDYEVVLQPSNSLPIALGHTSQASLQLNGLEDERHYKLIVHARDDSGIVSSVGGWQQTTAASPLGYVTFFDHIAQNAGFWTGVAMVNNNDSEAAYTLIARNNAGREVSRQDAVLPAGHKRLSTIDTFFNHFDTTAKSLEIRSSLPLETLELFGSRDGTRMTGLPTGDQLFHTAHILVGPCDNIGHFSTFGLFNPFERKTRLQIEGFDRLGRQVGVGERELGPLEQLAA